MDRGDTIRDPQAWLSTGQAARFCSVKPDTILKWIKRGKITAQRTAGGHYRIQRQVLEPLVLAPRPRSVSGGRSRSPGQALRCWEYLGRENGVPESCRDCLVLQSRASWCFELVARMRELGHTHRLCSESCGDCGYYHRVRGLATRVLVISRDDALRRDLEGDDETLCVRLARNGYDASAVICEFRPTFVVVDHDLMRGRGTCLLDHLVKDSRVPGVRVVLAAARGRGARVKAAIRDEAVVGVIEKPFGRDRIIQVVDAFPVELGEPGFTAE